MHENLIVMSPEVLHFSDQLLTHLSIIMPFVLSLGQIDKGVLLRLATHYYSIIQPNIVGKQRGDRGRGENYLLPTTNYQLPLVPLANVTTDKVNHLSKSSMSFQVGKDKRFITSHFPGILFHDVQISTY